VQLERHESHEHYGRELGAVAPVVPQQVSPADSSRMRLATGGGRDHHCSLLPQRADGFRHELKLGKSLACVFIDWAESDGSR
jgi:hypothetical protein